MREPTEAEIEGAAEEFLRGAPCKSQYNGNSCELDAGHTSPHSRWIEGWVDLTWTDEEAAADHQKTVDYWAERGVVWPPVEEVKAGPPLTIYVGVDDRGCGYVLSWTGDATREHEYALSQIEAFAEEVSNQGRCCEDLCMPKEPGEAGLYRWERRMFYPWNPDPEVSEPEFEGKWISVHLIARPS